MIRSQDCKPLFKIFSGEYFKFPKKYSKTFLAKAKYYVVAPKETDFDIDEKRFKNFRNNCENNFLRYKIIYINNKINVNFKINYIGSV